MKPLTPIELDEIRVTHQVQRALFKWISETRGNIHLEGLLDDFPGGCCEYACHGVLKNVSEVTRSKLRMVLGKYEKDSHFYLIFEPTGSIIDPTAGQFIAGSCVRLFRASDPEFSNYHVEADLFDEQMSAEEWLKSSRAV